MIWSLVKIMGLLHDIPCGKTQTKNSQKIKNHIFLLFNRFGFPRRGKHLADSDINSIIYFSYGRSVILCTGDLIKGLQRLIKKECRFSFLAEFFMKNILQLFINYIMLLL